MELFASFALAAASPAPARALPYAAIDVPPAPMNATLGVALMGIAAGLMMGAALVAELVVMARRAQILGYKRRKLLVRLPDGTAGGPVPPRFAR